MSQPRDHALGSGQVTYDPAKTINHFGSPQAASPLIIADTNHKPTRPAEATTPPPTQS